MSNLIFYKQVREDGGVRTGIEINDLTYFELYQPSEDEPDPALIWFADVRCEGPGLPSDPEESRQWLLNNAQTVQEGLKQLTVDLRAGIDVDGFPLQRVIRNSPRGTKITIVCSAVRRMTALKIARELNRIRQQWKRTIRNLPAAQAIS